MNSVKDGYMLFRFTELEGIDCWADYTNRVKETVNGVKELKKMIERNSIRFTKEKVL